MPQRRFSERHGFARVAGGITIVEDAPAEVRDAVLNIAEGELGVRPSILRGVLCRVLRKMPDSYNWSDYPNVWGECQTLITAAPWYRVYEFIESLYQELANSSDSGQALRWADLINQYFLEAGVGWRLVDGELERREGEAFAAAVDRARDVLGGTGMHTARNELQEALRDISRKPQPDLTGAIQHSIAALECTARTATGDENATLGDILRRNPDIVPRPLDAALEKIWGYSSEFARHLREGRQIAQSEAVLVVTVSAAICTYLAEFARAS